MNYKDTLSKFIQFLPLKAIRVIVMIVFLSLKQKRF